MSRRMEPRKLASSLMVTLSLCIAGALALIIEINLTDMPGYAGVVGFKAEGMKLSCGGHYQPESKVIFHSEAPCGSTVTVINPTTGQSATAKVVNQNIMHNQHDSRIADISPALAVAIGIDPHPLKAPVVIVRTKYGWAPVIPHLINTLADTGSKALNQKELSSLTNNILGECGNCSSLGMVAVGQVTQNRANLMFNNKKTITAVVHDKNQFSWLKLNPSLKSAAANRQKAQKIAALMMQGRLSGDALAVQYQLTENATHFYAPRLVGAPSWTHTLKPVNLPKSLENELRHRFYATGPEGTQLASR